MAVSATPFLPSEAPLTTFSELLAERRRADCFLLATGLTINLKYQSH